jgi:chaperonin cofactor prefoldin
VKLRAASREEQANGGPMNRIVPMIALAVLAMAGCSQNDDVARLRAEIARQDIALQAEAAKWESERDALKREIAAMRARLGEVAEADPSRPLAEVIGELVKRVDAVEKSGESGMASRVSAVEAKVEATDKKAEEAKAETGQLRQEMKEAWAAERVVATPNKNFAQAIARLKISEAEKEAIRQSIVDCKKAQLELLETPTADGRIFAEEVIDAFIRVQDGKASQADIGKLFMEIAGTKVPGDAQTRTYLQVIEEAKKANRENISKLLTKEDQDKLTQAHADWSEFELGEGDPWGALFMQRMEKYQKQKEG